MAGLKLFSIASPYDWLDNQLNFKFARECGTDIHGLIISFATAYLEALIIAQNTPYSNFIFLEHIQKKIQDTQELPYLSEILSKISDGEAEHEAFVKRYKSESELLNEIISFGSMIIGYDSNDTLVELFQKLEYVSTVLNLQFKYYYSSQTLFEIKKNKYIFPLVLCFLINVDSLEFYTLYHENYKVINVENLNTSFEFFYDQEYKNNNYPLEKLASDLVDIFAEASPLLQANEKDTLIQNLASLKSVSSKGDEFQKKLDHILK
ncbi:hypothetical protein SteCoe_21562 [Stentor coeruleus]|uniref:Uncharacterized protein n=1 Tax=Stentor coeruleus TaxID=5963 RepID=A0A1R2BP55_9CILI|nr:hypothetical protein SteCoe_21562 [Stentor coeruleus]